jgi:BetI-type transcriptional repressor, C-terminal
VIDLRTSDHLAEYLAAKAEDPDLGFMTGMVRLMRRGAQDLDLTRLFIVVVAEATSPDHPAHEWAIRRYDSVTDVVVEALQGAQERELLRPDFDVRTTASTLLAAMDGLQLRYLLGEDLRLDQAFAAVAGQMLSDLAFDSPRAAEAIAAWRRAHTR